MASSQLDGRMVKQETQKADLVAGRARAETSLEREQKQQAEGSDTSYGSTSPKSEEEALGGAREGTTASQIPCPSLPLNQWFACLLITLADTACPGLTPQSHLLLRLLTKPKMIAGYLSQRGTVSLSSVFVMLECFQIMIRRVSKLCMEESQKAVCVRGVD